MVLKFVPVIITVAPTVSFKGVKDLIIVVNLGLFLNTETMLLFLLVIVKSGLLSPSKSPMAKYFGCASVKKLTFCSKLTLLMLLVFRNTETELLLILLLATAKSGLPSPSMSLIAKEVRPEPDI